MSVFPADYALFKKIVKNITGRNPAGVNHTGDILMSKLYTYKDASVGLSPSVLCGDIQEYAGDTL